jgi:hypothetical protein
VDNIVSWEATYEEIKNNKYNLLANRYKPVVVENMKYEEPSLLIKEIDEIEKQIDEDVKSLKKEIGRI